MITTDESLLDRVKDVDAHDAWRVFYDLYWQPIIRYGRKLGLSAVQAEEVLQDTMVALMHRLPEFEYDRGRGRFRNFLLTIVHRKALGFLRRRARESAREVPLTATESLADESIGPAAEDRWRQSIAATVLAELRADPEIDPRLLAVFDAYAIRRRPAAEVAAEFGLKENTVHQTKTRILRRLRAAVHRRLRDSGGPDGLE